MSEPWAPYISTQLVLELHAEGIRRYPPEGANPDSLTPGAPKPGCVEGVIGNAYTAHLYEVADDEPGLFFAFNVMRNLAVAHCFTDGNKRASWLALIEVLGARGLTLDADDDDVESFVLANLSREQQPNIPEALAWLAARLVPLTEFEARSRSD